jgi:hypothetical protein
VKKLLKGIAGTLVGVVLLAGAASADSASCGSIVDSGPGSTNYVYCENHTSDNITCNNNIVLDKNSNQSSGSGAASTNGNTTAGGASSGNASNDNSTSTSLNTGCEVATAAVTAPATTPAAGSSTVSAPAASPAAKAATPTAAALPETGSDTVQKDALMGAVGLGGLTAVSQMAVFAFKRHQS